MKQINSNIMQNIKKVTLTIIFKKIMIIEDR